MTFNFHDYLPQLARLRFVILLHGARIILIIALIMLVVLLLRRLVKRIDLLLIGQESTAGSTQSDQKKKAKTLVGVANNIIGVVALLLGTLIVLTELGIDIGPIIAGAGVAGIAIGFGAQSLVKDYISGFIILIEDQYGVGDDIRVAGVSGVVENITLRRTVLRDLDGVLHIVPNGEIKVVSNLTK